MLELSRSFAAERLAQLEEVSRLLAGARTPAEATEVIVRRAVALTGAIRATVHLRSEEGDELGLAGGHGVPEDVLGMYQRIPLDLPVPVAEVVRSGAPLFLESWSAVAARFPTLAPHEPAIGGCAWAVAPLAAGGRVVGALALGFAAAASFPPEDRSFILLLATLCGQALDRARAAEAEAALRLYREIFRQSEDAIAIIDPDGRYLEQNQAHQRLVGYEDAELAVATPAIHFGAEAFARVGEALARSGRFRGELVSRTKAGGRRDVELTAFSIHDAAGRVVSHVGIKRDVTERREMEREVRQRLQELEAIHGLSDRAGRAERLDEVFEAGMDCLERALGATRSSILLVDDEGVMRFCAWRGLSEAYRVRVEGHSPWSRNDLDPQPIAIADALDDKALAPLHEALRAEGIRALAFVPLLHQGALIGKFMIYHGEPRPFSEDDMRVARTIAATVASAAARIRSQDALRKSERIHRSVFDTLDEGVVVVGWPDRRILHVNRAVERIFGHPREALLGRTTEVLHVDHETYLEFGRLVGDALARGEGAVFEFNMRRATGEVFPSEQAASVLRTSSGEVLGGISVIRDMSARKRAEGELDRARQQVAASEKLAALGTLVSGIAHEMRTPLTYVANNLYLTKHRMEVATAANAPAGAIREEVDAYLADALDGVDRLNRLVLDLRAYAQRKTGERAAMGLHVVAEEALSLFRAAFRGRAEVVTHLQPTARLLVDKVQVQQVLLNLLENAVEASTAGGVVRVITRPVPGGAELVVEDEGRGIPPEVQPFVFDEFYTTKQNGTGLGLAIVRRIVRAHGGTIRFETEPGRGTRFIVMLPAGRGASPP